MELVSSCTSCGTQFKVDAVYAGKKARCPSCATVVNVPGGYAQSLQPPPPVESQPPLPPIPSGPALPTIMVQPSAAAAGSSSVAAKLKRPPLPAYVPIAAGSVVAIVILAGFYGLMTYLNSIGRGHTVPPKSALIFNLSAEDRKVTSIYIDDKEQSIPFVGVIRYELKPGAHRVVMKKSGSDRIEDMVTLRHGDRMHIRPQWKEKNLRLPGATESVADSKPSDQLK